MEVSVMGSSQMNLGKSDLGDKEVGYCSFTKNLNSKSKICVGQSIKWPAKSMNNGFSLKASASTQADPVISENDDAYRKSKQTDGVKLFVGLPLDAVSNINTVNHPRAIVAGLKALKLLGVDGIELPVWWGVVEKETMGTYDWTGYLALAEMIQKLGLKLHVSLCFHASDEAKIPLPEWVSRIGESDPSIFFRDQSGQHYKDCLSFAVTDVPVLDGNTPVQVYKEFCDSFKAEFSTFMGTTITGISIGLGPEGELRYPSHHNPSKMNNHRGAGEFQCYDKYILNSLKQYAAESSGNPLWGLGGPHDAPGYDQQPMTSSFFKENGGSWETTYGDFFLSWYSEQLISHGSRLLSLASETFHDVPISICGKVPLVHSWYRTRSHPSELTTGFYNTVNRDGYVEIVEMFAKHSCQIILPGMDLSDNHQPNESLSSPEMLLAQITSSCRKHGVEILGQNSTVANASNGFEQIKKNLSGDKEMSLFTYQRMGADFFSPAHFPSFTQFVRNLNQPEQDSDDQPMKQEECVESLTSNHLQMQAA